MPIRSQTVSLLKKGADLRMKIFGRDQDGEQQTMEVEPGTEPVPCYFSEVKTQQQLDDANMKGAHDTILRVNKSVENFKPRLGQQVRLRNAADGGGDISVRFKEFGHSALNPEYVIGCENIY